MARAPPLPSSAGWTPSLPGRAPFRLAVTVPEGWLAVSEGRLLGHVAAGAVTVSRYESTQPLDGPSLAAGRYERREEAGGGTPVETYFFPDSAPLADDYLRAAASAVAEKLVISPYTVNTHVRHIYEKMQIHKRSELLNYLNMQRSDF
mgnify:CR=1 FL=1